MHASPQKPAHSQGTKAQIRPKGRGLVVLAKPGNAMPCCHLHKSRRGGRKRKRQQNIVPWSFPPSGWVIPPAGGEDAHGAGMVPLSTPIGRDCARVPAGAGSAIYPQPASHPRPMAPRRNHSSLSSPQFSAAIRCSRQGHGDNTHKRARCWGSVRSSTSTL